MARYWRYYILAVVLLCFGLLIGVSVKRFLPLVTNQYSVDMLTATPEQRLQITDLLNMLLMQIPGSINSRVGLVHGSKRTDSSIIDRFQYDVVANVTIAGHMPQGTIQVNRPLSLWDDFMPSLVANRCPLVHVSDMQEDMYKARISDLGIKVFMGCPLQAANGDLQGVVFVLWTDEPLHTVVNLAYTKLRQTSLDVKRILDK
jgi:hypothetical protein